MSERQTVRFLQTKFREIGITPDHRRGQNFLIDLNLVRLLAETAELSADDVALEVGTGTGGLTELLAERAGAVITIELDENLHQLATELLFGVANVTFVQGDALANKNRFAARLLEPVRAALTATPNRRLKLVANLPYSIATPVIANLLKCDFPTHSMTCTIQKELADRIVAEPHSKEYGSLSIWLQSQCDCHIVRIMKPSVFWPRPKVDSAIVQLTVSPTKQARIPDRIYFQQFVRSMFLHRRKFLRSNLLAAFKRHMDKPRADRILAEMEFGPETRAEQIDVPRMIAFCELVRAAAPEWTL